MLKATTHPQLSERHKSYCDGAAEGRKAEVTSASRAPQQTHSSDHKRDFSAKSTVSQQGGMIL